MQHPVRVAVPNPLQELPRELLDHRLAEAHALERGGAAVREGLAAAAVLGG